MEKGTRRTRSQAAPEWTVEECLTLANEVSAVESEWRDSLPSFQKWQIIVENCNAQLENATSRRSLNQIKTKWDSLISDYKLVKQHHEAFWSLDSQQKDDLGLPRDFDAELFSAMDRFVDGKGNAGIRPGADATKLDSDPETREDISKVFLGTGFRKRRRMMSRRRRASQKSNSWSHIFGRPILKQEPSVLDEMIEPAEESFVNQLHTLKLEGREQTMAANLLNNAETIKAIIEGNLGDDMDYKLADLKTADEAVKANFVRLQGDQLIDCLGKMADTLSQFCDLVQECH